MLRGTYLGMMKIINAWKWNRKNDYGFELFSIERQKKSKIFNIIILNFIIVLGEKHFKM